MNPTGKNSWALAILLIAVIVYRCGLLEHFFGFSSSSAQFILTPFVLLSFFLFSIGTFRIPRLALLFGAAIGLLLGISSFKGHSAKRDSIKLYLAPFASDPREALTIKYKDILDKQLEELNLGLTLERLSNPLSNRKQADDFLIKKLASTDSEVSVLLSGSPRWLVMGVSPRIAGKLVQPHLRRQLQAFKLELAAEVSVNGLSSAFDAASQEYVARMLKAFAALTMGDHKTAEVELEVASSIVGRWTGSAHRAYVLWMLGTFYLNKAFENDRIESSYLDCAITYLTRARRFIRNKDNPELLAAVLNNRGVAHFLSYAFLGTKGFRKQALREFRTAYKIKRPFNRLSENPAWVIAKSNTYSIQNKRSLSKGAKKKKPKNKNKA